MSRLLQVDVLTAQGEVQVFCRKLLVDAQIEQYANLFTTKNTYFPIYLVVKNSYLQVNPKNMQQPITQKQYSSLNQKKISGTCQKEAPFILKYPLVGCSLI